MQLKHLNISALGLSPSRPDGFVPSPSRALQERLITEGVLTPITVRHQSPDAYEILTHPETWVAAGLVGIHEVPVVVVELTDEEAASVNHKSFAIR